ncbi:MAG: hypothetical protein HFI44_08050 [Lachnospiraceae bacterium]|nr:hypothetical protein [Lachnospiraceae bacterium]GFI02097.1 hypothetical protein IMSAGC005_00924 [Lachnospiraceae bacterium]
MKNMGLKLGSVFLAVVLWLVVTSVNDPTEAHSYNNIPVKLLNVELITDSGQVYEVLEGSDMISRVLIRAPRSVHKELKEENIIATADVRELSSLDTISIKLTTNLYASKISSITGSTDTVKLNIEDKRSKALTLRATTSGKVEDGYLIGEVTTDQNLVRISGPQSVIDQVVRASADVNVSGMTSDIVTNAEIKLYDAEDNEVSNANITQNIKSVGVKVSILQKASVPVNFSISGEPAPGFRATGEIEGNGGMIVIAGKSNVIRGVTNVEIPAEVLDITDQTEDYTAEIDIRQYLPDNLYLANSEDAVKTVTVRIEPEVSKKLEIREEKVRVINVPEGYNAAIAGLEESFVIEAIGLSRDVAGLQAGSISGVIDIQKWMQQEGMEMPEEGYYTVNVDFGLPSGVALLEPVKVSLHISEKEEE